MVHIPGVKHPATDSLSRHPSGIPEKLLLTDDIADLQSLTHCSSILDGLRFPASDVSMEDPAIVSALTSLNSLNLRSVTWDRVRTATSSDNNTQALINLIESDLP